MGCVEGREGAIVVERPRTVSRSFGNVQSQKRLSETQRDKHEQINRDRVGERESERGREEMEREEMGRGRGGRK